MTTPLCQRLDDDLADRVFFGPPEVYSRVQSHQNPEEVEFARHLCAACPLRQQCLDEALATPERYDRHGIRAGLLPAEREALRVRWKVTIKTTGEEWTGGPIAWSRQPRVTQP